MLQKGKVSAVFNEGREVTATPYGGGVVSVLLSVPEHLVGILPINTPIVYVTFDDNTGLVLSRMDGVGSGSGGSITAYTDGDAIIIETGKGDKS